MLYCVASNAVAVTGAITILQLKAVNAACEIIRVTVCQSNLTASAMQRVQIVRKTGAATVTAFTPLEFNTGNPASLAVGSTTGTGITASGEGTDGDILIEETFNVLNGWLYFPSPEERIVVPANAGIIAVKFPAAPASSMTTSARLVYKEFS